MCFAVPAIGKSFLNNTLGQYFNQHDNPNKIYYSSVCSDDLRNQIIEDYYTQNPGADREEAFLKTSPVVNKLFETKV